MLDKNALLLIVGIAALAGIFCVGVPLFLAFLRKKGFDVDSGLSTAKNVLGTADALLDSTAEILPIPALGIVDKIIEWAHSAVLAAEQEANTEQITKDQRKQVAVDIIESSLRSAGVEITDDIKKIIDGAVESAVTVLPHTSQAA